MAPMALMAAMVKRIGQSLRRRYAMRIRAYSNDDSFQASSLPLGACAVCPLGCLRMLLSVLQLDALVPPCPLM